MLSTRSTRMTTRPADPAHDAAPVDRRLVAWMGMALSTPWDWEIIRHATDPAKGKLAFVDRRRQRLLLSWAMTPQRPDLDQAVADYKAMDREDNPSVSFKTLRHYDGWRGYWRDRLTRLARYERDRNLWIELTIPWHGPRDAQVEADLVNSFRLLAPPPSDQADEAALAKLESTRWRAFGLDVTAPPGWMLDRAEVRPADVTWTFSDLADARRSVRINRRGMIDVWFDNDLKQHLREFVGYGPELRYESTRWLDYPAWSVTSTIMQKKWKNITGGTRRRTDIAWCDPEAHSVITVTATAPVKANVDPRIFCVEGYSVQ